SSSRPSPCTARPATWRYRRSTTSPSRITGSRGGWTEPGPSGASRAPAWASARGTPCARARPPPATAAGSAPSLPASSAPSAGTPQPGTATHGGRSECCGALRASAGRRAVAARNPVHVLADPARVVNHLVAVHEHRHPALSRELLDLGPVPLPHGHAHLVVLDARGTQLARHRAAAAQVVGRGLAAVEDGHRATREFCP